MSPQPIIDNANFKSDATVTDDARVALSMHVEESSTSLAQIAPPPYESTTEDRFAQIVKLNIAIQVVGSRGDVQPFLALGKELVGQGHRVRIATHDVFHDFVREAGLEFYPIGGDPAELMAYMVKNPGIVPHISTIKAGDISRKRRMIGEMLQGCWRSCIDPDPVTGVPFIAEAIIANPPSFAHVHCAQALSLPLHMVFTMPWTPTRAFSHPLANIRSSNMDEKTTNFMSYSVIETMTWQGLGDVINDWRTVTLGLQSLPLSTASNMMQELAIPHTYCWSPSLVPKPRDWSNLIDVCGFFFRKSPEYTPSADIQCFLEAGPPPIYIGFGSIVIDEPAELTNTLLQALRACKVRAIISRGWSKLGAEIRDSNVIFIDDCPHEWLFRHVAAVIHHGGSGTTACGLLNACPTLIVPFFGDQHFWGNMVARAGAGPAPIEYRSLTVDNLVPAIQMCLSDSCKNVANSMATVMRRENGVTSAVQSFHRHLDFDSLRCDLIPDEPATWLLSSKKLTEPLKLSGNAVSILHNKRDLHPKDLKLYRARAFAPETKRWDPLTAASSSLLGTTVDFATGLGRLLTAPMEGFKSQKTTSVTAGPGSRTARALGQGSLQMTGSLVKGTLVDMPTAIADGLNNVAYIAESNKKAPQYQIDDWKTGGIAAGKNFVRGFGEGLSEFVTKPYRGARDGGAWGFSKGLASGTVGLIAKPGAAMFGLLGYPAKGIYASLNASLSSVERLIMVSRVEWDEYRVAHSSFTDDHVQEILRQYDARIRTQ